jgi:hypothetical protein
VYTATHAATVVGAGIGVVADSGPAAHAGTRRATISSGARVTVVASSPVVRAHATGYGVAHVVGAGVVIVASPASEGVVATASPIAAVNRTDVTIVTVVRLAGNTQPAYTPVVHRARVAV